MTTEKSVVITGDCSGLDDSRSASLVKRYDIGPRYEQGFSAPDIIEKADGRFVLYDEVLPLLKIIQLQEALLAKQAVEMEAIGAGGVSGQQITGFAQAGKNIPHKEDYYFTPPPGPYGNCWGCMQHCNVGFCAKRMRGQSWAK